MARNLQADPVPEAPAEDTKGHTGELGSEGGSPSDLTQRERAHLNSSSAPARHPEDAAAPTGRLTFWLVLLVLLSVLLWWFITARAM